MLIFFGNFTTKMYNVSLNFLMIIYINLHDYLYSKHDTGISFVWNMQDMLGYVNDNMSDLEKASILHIHYVKEMFKINLEEQFIQNRRMNLNNTEKCYS